MGEKRFEKPGGEEIPPAEEKELNVKKYLEDKEYEKKMGENPLVMAMQYKIMLDELTGIFRNEALGLTSTQAEAIQAEFRPELGALLAIPPADRDEKQVARQIRKDLMEAKSNHDDAESIFEDDEGKFPSLKNEALTLEKINLRAFDKEPYYRLLVLKANPYMEKLASHLKFEIVQKLVIFSHHYGLTLDQIQTLILLVSPSGRYILVEYAKQLGLLESFDKKREIAQRAAEVEREMGEALRGLQEKHATYGEFRAAAQKLLQRKLHGENREKKDTVQ